MRNTLYHGDNLPVLRSLQSESVDLIYLDPPFKSDQNYNMLYKERDGTKAAAQIQAFSDTWTWDRHAATALHALLAQGGTLADALDAFHRLLHGSDMMAYLVMIAPRLVELRRVLKPTGSLYLHCDPTASHYLKILLDAIFRPQRFRNEIVWKRSDAHSDAKQGAKHFGRVHDVLLFFSKGDEPKFQMLYKPLPESTVNRWYRHVEDGTGRRFNKADVTGPGGAAKGNPHFEWNGITRYWRYNREKMQRLHDAGRLVYSKSGMAYEKRYLDESKGVAIQDWWDDIAMLRGIHRGGERLGYPTQKPEALLERIVQTSSQRGDVVLDPFCGCGTTVAVAQRLGRHWIGIDITYLAIDVIVGRLQKLQLTEGKDYKIDRRYAPPALPDIEKLAATQPHTFQGWALQKAGIEDFQLKPGPDRGIDGRKVFFDPPGSNERREILVSVKGGRRRGANWVRDLMGAVQRERANIGVLIMLAEPTVAMRRDAADAPPYRGTDGRVYPGVQILTVRDLLAGRVVEYPLQLVAPVPRPVTTTPRRPTQAVLLQETELTLTAPRPKMAKAALDGRRMTVRHRKRR